MKQVPLIIFGLGNVGRALIQHIVENQVWHATELGVSLDVVGLCDRDGAAIKGLADEPFSAEVLLALIHAKQRGVRLRDLEMGYNQDYLVDILDVAGRDGAIVVDVTAGRETIPALLAARQRDYSLVLANKLPLADQYVLYRQLTAGRRIRFETTVGSALPIIAPLQTMIDTGDQIRHIQGCLSGTLGFLCWQLEQGQSYSVAVQTAKEQGYTEPDPRQDLGGLDAARKALILARLAGHTLEMEDVQLESLYPAEMDALSVDQFMAATAQLDTGFAQRARQASQADKVLRYVADISADGCRVGLQAVPRESRLGQVRGSDSIVVVHSSRYDENPLTISGRGAGPVITAAGVLGDILSLAACSG